MNFADSIFGGSSWILFITNLTITHKPLISIILANSVSLDYNHVNPGYPNIVSSIPFEPFDEVPYYNENSSQGCRSQKWNIYGEP